MNREIFQAWSEAISDKNYFPVHFIAQEPNLARDYLNALISESTEIIALLPTLIAYTENSTLKPREFLDSLFQLRDIFVQSKIKSLTLNSKEKRNFLDNLEQSIIKLSTYFTHLKADFRNGRRDRHLIDSPQIEECIFHLDPEFRLKNINAALLKKFHCHHADIISKPLSCLFSDTSHPLLSYVREEFMENRRLIMELEAEAITLTGKRFRCLLKLKRMENPDDKYLVSGTIKDITYIQETKSLLNLMSMALESVGEGIVITQNDADNKILYANLAFETLSGYKKFQLMGHPFDILRKTRTSKKVWKIARNSPDSKWKGEAFCKHKSGKIFPVNIHSQPVRDEHNNILARVSILRDLTVSKKRMKEIRELQQFIESIINNLHHAVVVTDSKFRILYGNSTVQQIFSVEDDESTKKIIYEAIPELREYCSSDLIKSLSESKCCRTEKKYLKNCLSEARYYSVSIALLPTGDKDFLLLWDLEDVHREETLRQQITLRNSRLAILENLASALNRPRESTEISNVFCEHLQEILEFTYLDIFVTLDASRNHLQQIYSSHFLDFPDPNIVISIESLCPEVPGKNLSPCQIHKNSSQGAEIFEKLKYEGANHLLFLPIFFAEELTGAVFLGHYQKVGADDDELEFLTEVAAHLGLALRNSQHFEQLDARNKRFSLVNQIFALTQDFLKPEKIFSEILNKTSELVPGHFLAIYHKTGVQSWRLLSHRNFTKGSRNGIVLPQQIEFELPPEKGEALFIDQVIDAPLIKELLEALQFNSVSAGSMLKTEARYFGELMLLAFQEQAGPLFDYQFRHRLLQETMNEIAFAVDQSLLFEKAMKGQQEWQLTFNAIGIGVAILDEHSNVLRANSFFWEIFGNIRGCLFNYPELVTQKAWKVVEGNLNGENIISPDERIILFDETRSAFYSQQYFPLSHSKTGSGIITLKEITEEREKDEHIRYLSQFPESNPNLVISINKENKIQYINPALEKFLKKMEMTPARFKSLLPHDLISGFLADEGQPRPQTDFQLQIGDQTFQFVARASSENNFLYLFGMDITDQLQMQGQLIQSARLRAMGEMAAGIAHDFNNLLATILGRTQLLQMKNQNPSLDDELIVIERAAQEGGEIVKKLQESTKTKREKHFRPVYLSDIIEDSLQYSSQKIKINTQVKGRTIRIEKKLAKNIIVYGNPIELKEMFTNLFFNAYDAIPDSGKIFINSRKANGKMTEIIIRDTGVGIPEEIIHRIFDPFFTTKGELGTGLGLNMVYNIVTAHRGKIAVNSVSDQGTEFRIELPISNDKPEDDLQKERMTPMEFSHMRLLVVDDEPELLNTMAEILRLKFLEVDMAGSGQEALELIRKKQYHVVLTDLGMPEVSGWEVAREAKKLNAQTRTILVTGWGMQAEDELGHHYYVDSIISKPYDLVKLFETIQQIESEIPEKIKNTVT